MGTAAATITGEGASVWTMQLKFSKCFQKIGKRFGEYILRELLLVMPPFSRKLPLGLSGIELI